MDSNDSDFDDLADIDLSSFNPRPDLEPDIQRHDDGWYEDSVENENTNSGNRMTDDENTSGQSGNPFFVNDDRTTTAGVLFPFQSHPINNFAMTDEHSTRNNDNNNMNPFIEQSNNDELSPNTQHTTDAPAIDPHSSENYYEEADLIIPSTAHREFSPLNPFVRRPSNNPFASDWNDKIKKEEDSHLASDVSTEYVYMRRLPEENLGMVLGIDGDQENRKPINSVHVKSITPGGAAARACQGTNRIEVGDEIREIDGCALNSLTHDECIGLFQEMPSNVVLTISRRRDQSNVVLDSPHIIDKEFTDSKQLTNSALPPRKEGDVFQLDTGEKENQRFETLSDENIGESIIPKGFDVINVTVVKEEEQSLGLSIVPSYGATRDLYQVKRLVPAGACIESDNVQVADRLLTCNGYTLKNLSQSQCLHILKTSGPVIRLTVLRQNHSSSTHYPDNSAPLNYEHNEEDISNDDYNSNYLLESTPYPYHTASAENEKQHFQSSNTNLFLYSSGEQHSDSFGGDDDVFRTHKENDAKKNDVNDTNELSVTIPPPAQFSDLTTGDNEKATSNCVTNIDDLLSLDVKPSLESKPFENRTLLDTQSELLISFDDNVTLDPSTEQQNPFLLDNPKGPQSLEEFAELCFQNISESGQSSPNPVSKLEDANEFDKHSVSILHNTETHNLPDLVSFEDHNSKSDIETLVSPTLLPVSSEPDKFVSTILVEHKSNEITTDPHEPALLPPFTTNIKVNSPPGDEISKVDVNTVSSKPTVVTTTIPELSPPPTLPVGSIVFHTYAGSSPSSISSASIHLDGDHNKITPEPDNKAEVMDSRANIKNHNSEALIETDDDYIRPMKAVKDEKGRVTATQLENKNNSQTESPKNFNNSHLDELANVLNGFSNNSDHSKTSEDNDHFDHGIEEEQIVASNRQSVQSEIVFKQITDSNQSQPGQIKNPMDQNGPTILPRNINIVSLMHSTQSDHGDDTITPLNVTKNSNGTLEIVPYSSKGTEPEQDKNMSDLTEFLVQQSESSSSFLNAIHGNPSDKDIISEDDIIPIVLDKKEKDIANNVLSLWTNAPVKTPEEKHPDSEDGDFIRPTRRAKDPAENSAWLSLTKAVVNPSDNVEKVHRESSIREMADFLSFNDEPVHNQFSADRQSGEGNLVEEHVFGVSKIERDQSKLIANTLDTLSSKPPPKTSTNTNTDADNKQNIKHLQDTKSNSVEAETPVSVSKNRASSKTIDTTASENSDTNKKVLNRVSKFESGENQSRSGVTLRSKPNNPGDFKSKLAGFEKSSASFDISRGRPKSMVELPSSRSGLSLKPLSTIRPLGSTIAQRQENLAVKSGNVKSLDLSSIRSSSGSKLSGASFLPKTPRTEYPKTRQENGTPFQVEVLAGRIIGLGLKVKVSALSKYPEVMELQRTGPLGKSNNVKVGDYLLSVNGTDLGGQTDSRVQQNLRLLPRGLVKLVLSTSPVLVSEDNKPSDNEAKNAHPNRSLPPTSFDEDADQPINPTVRVRSLNNNACEITASNDFQLSRPSLTSTAKDTTVSESDAGDNISVCSSSVSNENLSQPQVTTRIEINPGDGNGSPMKISVRPSPTPRLSASVPNLSAIPKNLSYASTASSVNESWDLSSPESTPRESYPSDVNESSDFISTKPKEEIENKKVIQEDEIKIEYKLDVNASPDNLVTKVDDLEVHKSVEEEVAMNKPVINDVSVSLRSTSKKIPPPVAPRPRRPYSQSSIKSDGSNSPDSPKAPPSVAPKSSSDLSGQENSTEQEGTFVSTVPKGPKISAGYERLQAMTKAKHSKPSKIVEKSRTFVSSKAKLFESEPQNQPDSSKFIATPKPLNSSLLSLDERRKSTGSLALGPSALTRPKSLLPKGNLIKEPSIPEKTSPEPNAKSPTRMNSALSPRRSSLAEPSSTLAFTFAPKQAPRISTDCQKVEGKVSPRSQLSPRKEELSFQKVTNPSLNKSPSLSIPPSQLELRSENRPMLNSARRSYSEASVSESQKPVLTHQVSQGAMENTLKMFDDLLQDTPVTVTATDPSDILLWSPVRKANTASLNNANNLKKESSVLRDVNPNGESEKVIKDTKVGGEPSKTQEQNLTAASGSPKTPPKVKPRSSHKLDNVSSKKEHIQEDMVLPEKKSREFQMPKDFGVSHSTKGDRVSEDVIIPKVKSRESKFSSVSGESTNNTQDDVIVPQRKQREMHNSLDLLKDTAESKLPVEEETILPQTKSKDSQSPALFSLAEEEKQPIQEDAILPTVKTKDSHMPPALNLKNCDESNVSKDKPQRINSKVAVDHYSLLENLEKVDKTDNIVAHQISLEISKESLDNTNNSADDLMKSTSNSTNENIPATRIAQSIEISGSNGVDILLSNSEHDRNSDNIPASKIANEILNEGSTHRDYDQLLNQGLANNDDNIPASRLAKDIKEGEVIDDNKYRSQANEIVQTVFTRVSSQPDSIFTDQKLSDQNEPPSPSSSDDEPPPLPGAPPPPIIFRNNSAMLTEREWIDELGVTSSQNTHKVNGNDKPDEIVLEDMIAPVQNKREHHAPPRIFGDMPVPGPEQTKQELISNFSHISPNKEDMEMNLVGQNIANEISHDMSGEEEDSSHSKSDSSEPFNSTGESCFHEPDAVRMHSPASVDVLSEDSGMPADDEFQEVNTDDAISPITEFKDNEIIDNIHFDKNEVMNSSSVLDTQPQITKSHSIVSNKPPSPPSSPPPVLPSSRPPRFNELQPNPPHNLVSSVSQSSDSPLSSKETSTHGDHNTATNKHNNSSVVVDEVITKGNIVSVKSEPVKKDEIVVNRISTEKVSPVSQHREITNTTSEDNDTTLKDTVKGVTVESDRKWQLCSNALKPSLVIEGAQKQTVPVDYDVEILTKALSHDAFALLLTRANDILDSLSAPTDFNIFVIHIHRDTETVELGMDLKSDSWYKVTKIRPGSPVAIEGTIQIDDWLIAVDNLWYPQVSLMRCLARLTKPKQNSLLVVARSQSKVDIPSHTNGLETTPKVIENPIEVPSVNKSVEAIPKPSVRSAVKSQEAPTVNVPETPIATPRVIKAESPKVSEETKSPSAVAEISSGETGVLEVKMVKGATGVGFCLEGGVGSPKGNVPIIIKRIFKGGPAEKSGQLKVKDEILSVNGVDFTTLRHYEAWNHLKFLDDGEVQFKIRRN